MAYNPQSEEEFRDQYGRGRYGADSRRYRPDDSTGRPEQPNDFRDYNHGPDSYPPPRRQSEGRSDDFRAGQGFGRSSRPGSFLNDGRRQGAGGYGYGDVGREYGQGRAGYNGDQDRGYDQNGLRGGLGSSGGPDDFADRRFDQDRNPFRGGYGGGDYDHNRREEPLLGRIGMNSRGPSDNQRRDEQPQNQNRRNDHDRPDEQRDYGRGWNDMDDHRNRGRRR